MITAEEARKLSGMTADEYLESLEALIREAAAKGRREIYVRVSPYADWLYDEKKLNPQERKTLETLRENGFRVSLYYNCGPFVDLALVISWDPTEEKQP